MQRLGRYELLGRIGRGSTAEVFAAQLTGPGGFLRRVAIKRIRPEFGRSPRFRELTLVEARLAATLEHRNIVQVYELIEEGDEVLVVMEYADGGSLRTLLDAATAAGVSIPWPIVAHVASELCAALAHIHRLVDLEGRPLELVHRDLSPENVLLTRSGSVKLGDFGIARARGYEQNLGNEVIGRAQYMPAEQQLDVAADAKVDLFALGAVLYELASGTPPFPGGHALAKQRQERPVHLAKRCPDYPAELCERVMSTLADEPGERPTAEALSVGITRVVGTASNATLLSALSRFVAQLVPAPPLEVLEVLTLPERPAVERHDPAVGVRRAQVRALVSELERSGQLVTLVGPPGAGKTTVAREVTHALAREVYWAALGGQSSEQALETLAETLGFSLPDAANPARLSKAMAGLVDSVLVLDDVAPSLGPLVSTLAAGSSLRVLATSTGPLGIEAERVIRLAPLSGPEALVIVERELKPSADSRPTVERVLARLDGSPLEVGLAVQAMKQSSAAALEQRLIHGEGLADTTSASAQRAFDRLWKEADERDQALLGTLSVFHGGFTVEAASAVAQVEDSQEMAEALERLTSRSLLAARMNRSGPSSARTPSLRQLRYAVPEWFRQRLVKRLGSTLDAARDRHVLCFVRAGSNWLAGTPGHLGQSFREMVRDDAENLLAVHQRSLQSFPLTGRAVNHAMSAALVLSPLLMQCGPFERLLSLLDSALSVAEPLGCHPPLVVRALVTRAELHRKRGMLSDAEYDATRAAQRCEALKDPRLLAETLLIRAALCIDRTHHEQAAAILDQLNTSLLASNDQRLRAQTHALWARLALEHGDFESSLSSAKVALETYQSLGDEQYEAVCKASLGAVHLEEGRFAAARTNHTAAIATLETLGDRYTSAIVRGYLGLDELFAGDEAAARAELEAAVTALTAIGEHRFSALFKVWGAVVQRQRALVERVRLVDEASAVLTGLGDDVFGWAVRLLGGAIRGAAMPDRSDGHPERDNDVRLARRCGEQFSRRSV